jgi:hypothetical protein
LGYSRRQYAPRSTLLSSDVSIGPSTALPG